MLDNSYPLDAENVFDDSEWNDSLDFFDVTHYQDPTAQPKIKAMLKRLDTLWRKDFWSTTLQTL